jgi:hypothetical protein
MKLQEDGSAIFFKLIKREWKGTWFQEILQCWDSQFALSMFFQDNNITNSEAVIVKIDSSGTIQWSKNYESDLYLYYFQDLIETRDSGLAATTSISFSAYNDYSFIKTDRFGHTCADSSFTFELSDTSFFAVSNNPSVSSLDITIDSIALIRKGAIPEQFTICEDDSFISPLTAVNDYFFQQGEQVLIFPNPTKDDFNFESNIVGIEMAEIKVYDLAGQLLLEQRVTSTAVHFGRDLSTGIYRRRD